MAIKGFATNNLVEGHDNYVTYMKKRRAYISEEGGEPTEVLICKPGLVSKTFGLSSKDNQVKLNAINRDISMWHCIVIAYDIWYDCVRDYVEDNHGTIQYKKFVNVPESVLKKFKFRFEQSIKNAKCDYARYTNPDQRKLFNACRYLVRFWTYLDIVKDCKTQRFFPNNSTIKLAAKVFGYKDGENPFIMNGKYRKSAERKEEKKPMEETKTTKYNLNLDTPISDLNFSTRTFNALRWAGYNKLGDIVNLKYENLIKIRNLGLVSTKEVLEKLNEIRQQSEAKEESVIDIAEQAAKEVEEERLSDTEMVQKYNKALDDIHEMGVKIDSITSENEAIKKKAIKISDEYDILLKQKLDLETCVSRLRDDISTLKEENQALTAQSSRLRIASDPKNLDTFALLNTVLEKMKDSKMEYILLTIDGMCIDIHPAQKVPLRSAYQIRSSEVR